MTWGSRSLAFLSVLLLAGVALSEPAAPTWKQIDDEEGIRVWKLEVPGVELPGFRGETVIRAPAEEVVRVLKQREHHTEWMKNCVASDTLRVFDNDHSISYNRTAAPWPVWDRDVILDTQFKYDGDRITLAFHNVDPKLRPLPEHVVRMPRLVGDYLMTKLGADVTRVRYTVEVDVGGSLPTWLATRIAKEMPYETLKRLRGRLTGQK